MAKKRFKDLNEKRQYYNEKHAENRKRLGLSPHEYYQVPGSSTRTVSQEYDAVIREKIRKGED